MSQNNNVINVHNVHNIHICNKHVINLFLSTELGLLSSLCIFGLVDLFHVPSQTKKKNHNPMKTLIFSVITGVAINRFVPLSDTRRYYISICIILVSLYELSNRARKKYVRRFS